LWKYQPARPVTGLISNSIPTARRKITRPWDSKSPPTRVTTGCIGGKIPKKSHSNLQIECPQYAEVPNLAATKLGFQLKAEHKDSTRSMAPFSKEWSLGGFFEIGFWAKQRTFIRQLEARREVHSSVEILPDGVAPVS
jgi:hypothetical protein